MDIDSIPDLSLAECLQLVEQYFDMHSIAARSIDQNGVLEYFRQSDLGYRLFHSKEGAMHVALNCDEQFSTAGYLGQVDLIEKLLASRPTKHVLEIGCGVGYITRNLAQRVPDTQFTGLDLSPSHIDTAKREAQAWKNVTFEAGDFQRLPSEENQFHVVVAVECLCQASDRQQALREAYRVLRPGGRLIVIDVFRQKPLHSYDNNMQLAAQLVEKAMAVNEFAVLSQWLEETNEIGFGLLEQTDLSEAISHNLARFHRLALRFFEMPLVARPFLKALPPRLQENSISGLLMPFTVGSGAQSYCLCVLERPESTCH